MPIVITVKKSTVGACKHAFNWAPQLLRTALTDGLVRSHMKCETDLWINFFDWFEAATTALVGSKMCY